MALPFDIDPQAVIVPDLDVAMTPPGATPTDAEWAPNPARIIAKGLGTETVWFRVVLHNPDPVERRVWLEVNNASIDHVALAVDGHPAGEAGLLLPRSTWPASTAMPTFPIEVGPESTVNVVGEVTSENERQFEVVAIGDAALTGRLADRALLHGLFYGALATVSSLAALLAARLKDPVYAAYAVYAVAIAVWMSVMDGHAPSLLPWLPMLAPRLMYLIPGGTSHIAGILVVLLFVGAAAPRVRTALIALLALTATVFLVAAAPLLPWHQANAATLSIALLNTVAMVSATLVAWRNGVRGAQWIALGWLGFAAFLVASVGSLLTGTALPIRALDMLRAGVTCDLLGFAMALAARLQDVMAQRDAASASAIAAYRLGRYFPKALVQRILASEDEAVVKSERVLITVMFSDLRGFTDLSDRTSPERVTSLLNEFLAAVVPIIEKHGGAVDKMMGDGLMVLFGTPTERPSAEQAQSAVKAAIEMQAALTLLANKWRAEGLDHDVMMRVGIHQDYATVGNFGTAELMSRTAIGGGVNLAARLENGCTPGRILATFPVVTQTKGFAWGPFEERTYKGIVRPQKVAELDPTGAIA